MYELRWKLKTFLGPVKPRTGYVLERCAAHVGKEYLWECVTIENTNETLVFDQYPLGQAVPKIMDISTLTDDVDEEEE